MARSLDSRSSRAGEETSVSVFTTDGRYLYFTWREDDGDIWVMDVAPGVNQ